MWDVCTDKMQAKLKAAKDFQTKICYSMNAIALLEEIRKIMCNYQEKNMYTTT